MSEKDKNQFRISFGDRVNKRKDFIVKDGMLQTIKNEKKVSQIISNKEKE